MPLRPINSALAIGVAALPLPALTLLDRLNRGCGDGMCSFLSGLLILGALAAATLVFLRWVPVALWALVLAPLVY